MTPPPDKSRRLLPCPFCGSDDVDAEFALCEVNGKRHHEPGCMSCGATAPAALWNAAPRSKVANEGAPPSSIAASTEPARIPDLELARTNADYWLGCARHSDENNLGHALIHAEQAINAWKNAAYTMADQRDQFKALSEGLQLALDRPVSATLPPEANELAGMARDARRYRWLRDKSVPPHNFYISVPVEFKDERYTAQQVDAAIDAALGTSDDGAKA